MKLRVVKSVMRSDRIKHFTLAPIAPVASAAFAPGAHVTIELPIAGGLQGRQYSLMHYTARDALLEQMEIAVLLEPEGRGGSRRMHELAVGDVIDARDPVNAFPLRNGASNYIFIAGGIGITPLLCMARATADVGRSFQFHYLVRDDAAAAFSNELERLPGQDKYLWSGLDIVQSRHRLHNILSSADDGAVFYVCGPNGMIDSVHAICTDIGMDPTRIHFERFGAPAPVIDAESYIVRLSRSGQDLVVGPDQTLLEVLTAHGIVVHSSCGAGVCGSCLVEVLDGAIDHRDAFLLDSDREEGCLMCACVSRAQGSSLTLDL